jgi:hypothetical protein
MSLAQRCRIQLIVQRDDALQVVPLCLFQTTFRHYARCGAIIDDASYGMRQCFDVANWHEHASAVCQQVAHATDV